MFRSAELFPGTQFVGNSHFLSCALDRLNVHLSSETYLCVCVCVFGCFSVIDVGLANVGIRSAATLHEFSYTEYLTK